MERDASAVTANDAQSQADARPAARALARLRALGPQRLGVLAAVALGLLAFFAWLLLRAGEPPYTLLYGGLSLEDSAAVVAQLEAMQVRYRLAGDGESVLVQADQAPRLRMRLAEEGLPRGGAVGYEIFDHSSPLGTTSFQQNVNLLRALEGELARTIGAIDGVQAARVHLVQPRREVFRREQVEPSASIVLRLRGGRRLGQRQVQAVRHLVAAAVPGLSPDRVTIVDDQGTLLARGGPEEQGVALPQQTEEVRAAYEARLRQTIEELLERSLGPGRVRAEVRAEMDFDQVSTTSESFDPNSQVARSTQLAEEETELQGENRDDAVTVTGNLPNEAGAVGTGSRSSERTSRTEETVNYEISRTVRNHVQAGGRIERLSIAVLVDGRYQPGGDAQPVYEPRPAAELEQIATLVRSAAGFDAARGDVVEVINMRFAAPEPLDEPSGLLDRVSHAWLMRLVEMLTIAGLAVLVLLIVVKPTLRRLLPPPDLAAGTAAARALPPAERHLGDGGGTELVEVEGRQEEPEQLIDIKQVHGQVRASLVNQVAEVAAAKPDDAVRVIRSWLHES